MKLRDGVRLLDVVCDHRGEGESPQYRSVSVQSRQGVRQISPHASQTTSDATWR